MTPKSKKELRSAMAQVVYWSLAQTGDPDYQTIIQRSVDDLMQLFTSYHQQQLEQAVQEAKLNERLEVALDNYRGQTFSKSTDYEGKFNKFVRNNEAAIKRFQSIKEDNS